MSTNTRSDRHTPRSSSTRARTLLTLALLLVPTLARADDTPTSAATPASAPKAATSGVPSPDAQDAPDAPDALAALRERFREGMDKYAAGAFAEAIVIWESIYRDLGSDKGYRLAFDLARAYDQLGDPLRAADHYQAYLDRVHARRAAGEVLEPNVARQEDDARARCEQIAILKARIHVVGASRRPIIARVDGNPPRVAGFVVFVEPGAHIVTFGNGSDAEVRHVTVEKGKLIDVAPRDEPRAARTPTSTSTERAPIIRYETRATHPFPPSVLLLGAGLAAASFVIPILTYSSAYAIRRDYYSPSASEADQRRLATDYDSARTNAYASITVPALFTAAAGALAIWYLLGTKETRVPLPTASAGPRGASLDFTSRF